MGLVVPLSVHGGHVCMKSQFIRRVSCARLNSLSETELKARQQHIRLGLKRISNTSSISANICQYLGPPRIALRPRKGQSRRVSLQKSLCQVTEDQTLPGSSPETLKKSLAQRAGRGSWARRSAASLATFEK